MNLKIFSISFSTSILAKSRWSTKCSNDWKIVLIHQGIPDGLNLALAYHLREYDNAYCGMRDNCRHFYLAARENPSKYTVFGVEFNGIVRILSFRRDITIKFQKN